MRVSRMMRALAFAAALLFATLVITMAITALADPVSAAIVAGVALLALIVWRALRRRVGPGSVLEVDLELGVVESQPVSALERVINRGAVVLRDVVDALDRASGDDRVTGVVMRLGNGALGMGKAQELRQAVSRFRAAGKKAVAYSETFGESGNATIDYYLAASFDEIHLQPMGMVSAVGLVTRTPFLRSLFDRLGATPDFDHRREYKAAKYRLTETHYLPPHEESVRGILNDQMDQVVNGIAADRGLEPEGVRELIDSAPLLDEEALAAGLIDEISYRDQAYRSAGGDNGRFIYHDRYLKKAGRPHRKGPRVALVYGTGSIVRGRPGPDPLTRGLTLGADEVAQNLREAADDDKVKAIVFRVDSPGGSAVASEVVRREIVRAREAGLPVVVSMGDVAASGGYWISAPADRIVAQPGTITGSIGVVAGKLASHQAWGRVGVDWGEIHEGRNATFSVALHPYSDSERARLDATLDTIYRDFVHLVAEARSMSDSEVETVAKGRIWTGAQAAERGLVDEVGGLHRAVEVARELAGIPKDAAVQLKTFPVRRRVPFPERREGSDPIEDSLRAAMALIDSLTGTGTPTFRLVAPG